jgi:hypothetical protein
MTGASRFDVNLSRLICPRVYELAYPGGNIVELIEALAIGISVERRGSITCQLHTFARHRLAVLSEEPPVDVRSMDSTSKDQRNDKAGSERKRPDRCTHDTHLFSAFVCQLVRVVRHSG